MANSLPPISGAQISQLVRFDTVNTVSKTEQTAVSKDTVTTTAVSQGSRVLPANGKANPPRGSFINILV